MDLITHNTRSYLRSTIENVTQPERCVELRVRTVDTSVMIDRAKKITCYMAEQCKVLIPYFYELRNEIPRGRFQQKMAQRLRQVADPDVRAKYSSLINAEEFECSSVVALHTVTVEGNRVMVSFACDHDPEFALFERTMEIPFTRADVWAEVEAFYATRQLEEAQACERRASKAANDEFLSHESALDELDQAAGF